MTIYLVMSTSDLCPVPLMAFLDKTSAIEYKVSHLRNLSYLSESPLEELKKIAIKYVIPIYLSHEQEN